MSDLVTDPAGPARGPAPAVAGGAWTIGGAVDRAAALRGDPERLRAVLADARTRVLVVGDDGVVTAGAAPATGGAWATAAEPVRLAWRTPAEVSGLPDPDDVPEPAAVAPSGPAGRAPDAAVWPEGWLLLGLDAEGAPMLARRTGAPASRVGGWTGLRSVFAALDDTELVLAATAVALHTWHARHPRCPRCGAPTRPAQAGWSRVCTAEGSEHYPRTDPAVIMAVVDEADRLLLGHAAAWPQGRFSTLAGFVEPGESLEQAVRREVEEEAGVEVVAVEYVASQPWPFPASLMLGFRARARSAPAVADGEEVTEALWVTREELAARVASGAIGLPGRGSIARRLIEGWFGGRLGQD